MKGFPVANSSMWTPSSLSFWLSKQNVFIILFNIWWNLSRAPWDSCENTVISILDYVEYFKYKLKRACEIEKDNLKQNQDKNLSRAPWDSGWYVLDWNCFMFNLIDAQLAEVNET
jgi:hypothetical protein